MNTANTIGGIFGIIMLLIIYGNATRQLERSMLTLALRSFLVVDLLYCIMDTFTWALMEHTFPGMIACSYAANILCLGSLLALSYCWMYYVVLSLYGTGPRALKVLHWAALAPVLIGLMVLLSPWTHWMFYITADNQYIRGAQYPFFVAGAFTMMLAASALALLRRRREITRSARRECLVLSSFVLLPLCGGLIQGLYYGVNTTVPSIALSTLLVYLNQQNQQQSLDPLTNLNNRWQFDLYTDVNFKVNTPTRPLYLFLMDINHFKKINDTYGHPMGDEAIMLVGQSLKMAFAQTDAFLARYGGDEFAVVLACRTEKEAELHCDLIRETLRAMQEEKKTPYRLTVSIGYASFGEDGVTDLEALIAKADMRMYEQKRSMAATR